MIIFVSCVGELMSIEELRPLFSLANFNELRVDFDEPPAKLLAPPDEESSSFIFGFWRLEPGTFDELDDVDDVDVVEEFEFTGLVASRRLEIRVGLLLLLLLFELLFANI